MPPLKQPCSLMQLCVKNTLKIINSACYVIEKTYPNNQFDECEREAKKLKCFLNKMLPPRLFDVLCSERNRCLYGGDNRIHLQLLTHPNMIVLRKCDFDRTIPECFWISTLSMFSRLVVLDLKFLCTDDMLEVIGESCPLLEELNMVSKQDFCQFLHNTIGLIKYVSDAGINFIKNLKQLRILDMDAPWNENSNRIGRGVTHAGIIILISELPFLEELRMEAGRICTTLVGSSVDIGPLSLRKIKYCMDSPDGIRKLFKICPLLSDLSVSYSSDDTNNNAILEQISESEVRLNKLDLLFFSYSDSMQQLLTVKGSYLTHFSLWEMHPSLTLDAVLLLGRCCPNLISLSLTTGSNWLPKDFQLPDKMFSELTHLTIGNENFDIAQMLTFFLECTNNLQKLVLKYIRWTNIDEALLHILEKGHLRNINDLWLDYYLEVSKDVVKRIIQQCEKLQILTVHFSEQMDDVYDYIDENNLDLRFGRY